VKYTYDSNGNLTQRMSPAPNQTGTATVTVSYCYDGLNRVTGKAYTAQTCSNGLLPTPLVSYFYDQATYNGLSILNGKGNLTGMSDPVGSEAWSHDSIGRVVSDERTTIGTTSVTKTSSYVYNLDGTTSSITYPFGLNVAYTVSGADRPTSVVGSPGSFTYVQSATYAPQGALSTEQNNASTNFPYYANDFYNSRLQPCRFVGRHSATAPSSCTDTTHIGDLLDLAYNFNSGSTNNGSVVGIANNLDATRSQTYSYDALNRVLTAQTQTPGVTIPNSNCWGLTFGYDPWGNLLQETASGPSGCGEPTPLNVTVNATNQIANNNIANEISNYCYDSAGNLIYITAPAASPGAACPTSGPFQYVYDAENRLITAAGVNYGYDGNGNRVTKSNGRIYWFGQQSDSLEISDLSENLIEQYIFSGGQRIARYYLATSHLFYYFSDQLGTARKLYLTGSSTPCFDADYYPLGGERDVISNTCAQYFKFTGKERDEESSLDHAVHRTYDSAIGRWMSPDPAGIQVAEASIPQSWNLYNYVMNNPLNFADPKGLDCAYLNDSGAGVESIDHDSDIGECEANGGFWANGWIPSNFSVQTDPFSNNVVIYSVLNGQGGISLSGPGWTQGAFYSSEINTGLSNAFSNFQFWWGNPYTNSRLLSLLGMRPITTSVTIPLLWGVGPTLSGAIIPGQNFGCGGMGLGAGMGADIDYMAVGAGDPRQVLSGWSFSAAGYTPIGLGGAMMVNGSGILAGPGLGLPGKGGSGTYSWCGTLAPGQ
jgi:RHS repeat-associated protein